MIHTPCEEILQSSPSVATDSLSILLSGVQQGVGVCETPATIDLRAAGSWKLASRKSIGPQPLAESLW